MRQPTQIHNVFSHSIRNYCVLYKCLCFWIYKVRWINVRIIRTLQRYLNTHIDIDVRCRYGTVARFCTHNREWSPIGDSLECGKNVLSCLFQLKSRLNSDHFCSLPHTSSTSQKFSPYLLWHDIHVFQYNFDVDTRAVVIVFLQSFIERVLLLIWGVVRFCVCVDKGIVLKSPLSHPNAIFPKIIFPKNNFS